MAALTPRTPMTSARKLFPRSPSSDCDSDNSLGRMSPLSSPDRYSSPPYTPDRSCTPPKKGAGRSPRTPVRTSPRAARCDSFQLPSKAVTLSPLFLHRDIKRLRKHVDLNNTGDFDKSFLKPLDVENEKTPLKSLTNAVIPQTPSQKSSNFGVIEESPDTPSINKAPPSQSTGITANVRKVVLTTSGSEPAIPANVFYGKPSLTRELFPATRHGDGAKLAKLADLATMMKAHKRYTSVDSLRSIGSKRSTRGNVKKRRRMPGEVNAGVYHKLRRPKPKKWFVVAAAHKAPQVMSRSKAESILKSAGLSSVDLTSLGPQVAQGYGNATDASETPRKLQGGQGLKRKLPDPPTPPPDPSKKFFKTNRTVHKTKTVTFEGNIKICVAEGKFTLNKPENPWKLRTRKVLKFKGGSAEGDPLFEAVDNDKMEQVKTSVRRLLEDLDNEPGVMQSDLRSGVAVGGIVIASRPALAEGTLADVESGRMEMSDEVVPGTPQKGQVIAEYVVDANGEITSPGLSFITSSLAISEDNLGSGDTIGVLDGSQVESFESGQQDMLSDVSGDCSTSVRTFVDMEQTLDDLSTNQSLENESSEAPQKENSCKIKYFPLFYKSPDREKKALSDMTNKKSPQRGKQLPWRYSGGDNQYQIDAGQKRLGATQCSECGLVYSEGDMDDELAHLNYHNSTHTLKFLGWKQERVVASHGGGRIVLVQPGDPKSWWKKAGDIVEVVDRDLGYADGSGLDIQGSKVYLYVEARSVIGCLVAQPIASAHRLQVVEGLDTCSQESFPVKCGISRLWVVVNHRRRGIATKLVNCMRTNFIYGYILGPEEFAFSVPTVSGKEFGTNYTKKQNFLVYM